MATNNSINKSSDSLNIDTTLTAGSSITTNTGNISALDGGVYVTTIFQATRRTNDEHASGLYFIKQRGSSGSIVSGDTTGEVIFQGYDGTSYITSAKISGVSSGTISSGKVPGYLSFQTMSDSTGTLAERMRISSEGNITINTPLSGNALQITGNVTVTTTVTGSTLYANGDSGGTASQNAITNVSNLTANGAGTFTIKSKSANNLDSSGFIKIYVGTTAYYLPIFNSVAP